VFDIRQDRLGDYQIQLVGGPLILNKAHVRARIQDARILKSEAFSNLSVDRNLFKAQVLRFYFEPVRPWEVVMYRIPVYSANGSIYRQGAPSRTILYMTAPV